MSHWVTYFKLMVLFGCGVFAGIMIVEPGYWYILPCVIGGVIVGMLTHQIEQLLDVVQRMADAVNALPDIVRPKSGGDNDKSA